MLDEIDIRALGYLMTEARITWAELAGRLGLSAPAAAERVRQLENKGVIQQYSALLSPEALGFNVTAFIAVSLEHPRDREAFLDKVAQTGLIQECHHVTGDDDYLLKVRCKTTRQLDWLLVHLKETTNISRTRTTIVLSTTKETAHLPLDSTEE